MRKLKVKEIALAASLAAVSAVVQLIHIGYQSPQFGMWIDIVAVTWIVALFLFGLRMSLIVSLIGAVIITLFAPETWLGAGMKWLASAPIWIFLGLWAFKKESITSYYASYKRLILPLIVGIVIRCAIIIPLNYFYAIPIWTGMTPAKAMVLIPWYIIALFNIVQSIVDVAFAWILVYSFRLRRFSENEIKADDEV